MAARALERSISKLPNWPLRSWKRGPEWHPSPFRRTRQLGACHAAEVGGFIVEGHVPAIAIRSLLKERLGAAGVAVAGMPVGFPRGMANAENIKRAPHVMQFVGLEAVG